MNGMRATGERGPATAGTAKDHNLAKDRVSLVQCDRRMSERQLRKTTEHNLRILSHRRSCTRGFMLDELQDT